MDPEKLFNTLDRYARSSGLELNNDRELVLDIINGLLKNEERYGYRSCPCRLASGNKNHDQDIICPCKYRDEDIKEYGSCYCSLYVTREWNNSSIPRKIVPERRKSGGLI